MRAGFLYPKCDNFVCLNTHQNQSERHLKRWFFFAKIGIFVSWPQAHLAKRKRVRWSIDFTSCTNWTVPKSLCKIHLNDVSEMLICWGRRWIYVDGASHTLSTTAAKLSCVLAFHVLIYRWGCQCLSLFHKITNIRWWRCFSSSKIRTQIFAHILQHYHDVQSNVALFPNVVQAYTQPYSFSGRIKLIIFQIQHELSVTNHEISSNSKKKMADQYYPDTRRIWVPCYFAHSHFIMQLISV